MSLRRDFNMYFEGSVVGILRDGQIFPFYVYGVEGTSDRDRTRLTFRGEIITDSRGNYQEYTARYSELVFELPQIGWMVVNDRYCWVTYQKRKTVKKGIVHMRLDGLPSNRFNRCAFWQFYFPAFNGRLDHDFAIINNEVKYKGYKIGTKRNNTIELAPAATYLRDRLGGLTQCQIRVTR